MRRFLLLALVVFFIPRFSGAEERTPQKMDEKSTERYEHQLSFGFGLPICMFVRGSAFGEEFEDTTCIGEELLWMNIPIMYRRRFNDWFAAGGGVTLNLFPRGAPYKVGGTLRGGVRVYFFPDYIYFNLDFLLGFPMIDAIVPAVGIQIPFNEKVGLTLENEVSFTFLKDTIVGFWQPVLGLEFRF